MLWRFRFTASALIALLAISRSISSVPSPQKPNAGDLVMMTVTLTTRSGEYAMGLKQSAFQINDEKESRTIEFFESDDSPRYKLFNLPT